jgi:hypothetical protein
MLVCFWFTIIFYDDTLSQQIALQNAHKYAVIETVLRTIPSSLNDTYNFFLFCIGSKDMKTKRKPFVLTKHKEC